MVLNIGLKCMSGLKEFMCVDLPGLLSFGPGPIFLLFLFVVSKKRKELKKILIDLKKEETQLTTRDTEK